MSDEHKDAAVQDTALQGEEAVSRGYARGSGTPAQSAPSPRQAVLEAARICDIQPVKDAENQRTGNQSHDYMTGYDDGCGDCGHLLRAYAATLPDESERDRALEEKYVALAVKHFPLQEEHLALLKEDVARLQGVLK